MSRNKTGKPQAFKKLHKHGFWEINFNPTKKIDGLYYYEVLQGFIDEQIADELVEYFQGKSGQQNNQKVEG